MKIKSSQKLLTLKREPLKNEEGKDFTLGQALSNILLNAEEGGKMKLFLMATKFYEGKDVELDEVDLGLVRKAVETTNVYTNNLVTGQALMILNEKV